MKITQIELFQLEPRWQFLKISTDEGLSGWGEPSLPTHPAAVGAAVQAMGELLVGRDPDCIEDIWQLQFRGGFVRGGPILMSALAGIDQALWDIKGRRYGLPIYQCLGGPVREKAQIYAWISGRNAGELSAAASQRLAQGYTAIKMDGPSGGLLHIVDTHAKVSAIVERVGAVRDVIGHEIGLAVDFHGAAHKAMAKALLKELEPLHPLFVEEPVLPENNDALREIASYTTIPIATGERMFSRWDFKTILQNGWVDIIQPDLSHAGGISEVKKIAAMAEAYDVAVAPHCPLGPIAFMACLQLAATTPNVFIIEQVLELHDVQASAGLKYVKEPLVFEMADGCVGLPKGLGLGLEIDEAKVREAAQRGHRWRVPHFRTSDGTVAEW